MVIFIVEVKIPHKELTRDAVITKTERFSEGERRVEDHCAV